MKTDTTSETQARRDAALAQLNATREAERRATEAHQAATREWLAATCGHVEQNVGWCTEAPGHTGEHRNLHGAAWSAVHA